MKSKLVEKREVLKAALKAVNYQITNLQRFYSKEQVWTWKVRRFKLKRQLEEVEEAIALQERSAPVITELVKSLRP